MQELRFFLVLLKYCFICGTVNHSIFRQNFFTFCNVYSDECLISNGRALFKRSFLRLPAAWLKIVFVRYIVLCTLLVMCSSLIWVTCCVRCAIVSHSYSGCWNDAVISARYHFSLTLAVCRECNCNRFMTLPDTYNSFLTFPEAISSEEPQLYILSVIDLPNYPSHTKGFFTFSPNNDSLY